MSLVVRDIIKRGNCVPPLTVKAQVLFDGHRGEQGQVAETAQSRYVVVVEG